MSEKSSSPKDSNSPQQNKANSHPETKLDPEQNIIALPRKDVRSLTKWDLGGTPKITNTGSWVVQQPNLSELDEDIQEED